MSFSRATEIDITRPDANTEREAVMNLDADLTSAFSNLNNLESVISSKLNSSAIGSASGACDLDDDTLVPTSRIPTYPASKLHSLLGYPVGSIVPYASDTLTSDMAGVWAECNGSLLSRSTYSTLFGIVGTAFGSLSSSDFAIPDLRGRFPRGWDHGNGIDLDASSRVDSDDTVVGDTVGSLQDCQNKSHTHNLLASSGGLTNPTDSSGTEYYSPGGVEKTGLLKTYGGTPWESGKAVSKGDEIIATTWNCRRYSCTKAGTTGGTEPTWSSYGIGDTITDNTAQWIVEVNTLSEFRPPNINVMYIIRIA